MIGPSSSHTAGAVKIGAVARALLGEKPVRASIQFHGSFARTYRGHGTDRAVVGGLLGMKTDDPRIPQSLKIAQEEGLAVTFATVELKGAHPNTAVVSLTGKSGKSLSITASSVGGGSIEVNKIGSYRVSFTGEYPTLIIPHRDTPGSIARVTNILAEINLNIAQMKVYRARKGGSAVMVIETDQTIPDGLVEKISGLDGIGGVMALKESKF